MKTKNLKLTFENYEFAFACDGETLSVIWLNAPYEKNEFRLKLDEVEGDGEAGEVPYFILGDFEIPDDGLWEKIAPVLGEILAYLT